MTAVQAAPVYHRYESVAVPPEACEVSATDCPLSIVGEEGVRAPAVRAELTVTRSVGEVIVGELVEVSVIL
jgi:hypothetical protein